MENQTFYANGKLLITGEYLVMQGALALAVPTVLGQEMHVETLSPGEGMTERKIIWKSFYENDCWFEGSFSIPDLNILHSSDRKISDFLIRLLREAKKQNPEHLRNKMSYKVETRLGFKPEWGLGSSSSLTNLLAEWFRIDPFELFKNTQKGSGYDITCARVLNPIWFSRSLGVPISQSVNFKPEFRKNLAFVYSGRKQDSAASVEKFLGKHGLYDNEKSRISEISRELPVVKTLAGFNALLDEHEEIMSGVLDLPKVKTRHFSEFPGSIKSLGAWGGDFLLASSELGFNEIKSYFSSKGLEDVFSFDEMILGDGQ